VKEFNKNRLLLVKGAKVKAVDESMYAYQWQTTSTGGLPNISFMKREPEPLGLYSCSLFTLIIFQLTYVFILLYN
jgi:hypothetical protein